MIDIVYTSPVKVGTVCARAIGDGQRGEQAVIVSFKVILCIYVECVLDRWTPLVSLTEPWQVSGTLMT